LRIPLSFLVIALLTSSALAQTKTVEEGGTSINSLLLSFAIGIVSGVAVLWIGGWRPGRKTLEQRGEAAPVEFHKRLGAQIELASPNIEVQARSIVTLRNEYRGTLSNLQNLLGSEIDTLSLDADALKAAQTPAARQAALDQMQTTLDVLRRSWPDRAAAIDVEMRKLYAEVNLRQI
jgi:hypothetical protein